MVIRTVLCAYTVFLNENDSHSHLVSCVQGMLLGLCLKGSSWFVLLLGLSMLTLSFPLMFLMYSTYLSLMTMEALVLGYPFFSFFHCGYKIKHNLRVCPYVFFAFLCYYKCTFNRNVSINRCQHGNTN